ncbi:Vesicle-mediated ER to Golgi transport protein [Knufia obscura]|uniref:Vesicle-mediated ER to Golgi transport protein n=1 Tax=Knufia obscura TaxID=1635080 RepID=A0ABR0RJF5_9EURO|nr:Vesicle-mediated ER to Golgi transport protein [Knufia obscura]
MLRILESQAPTKQTATDTINILSNRLSSATLLEDRRAAILGLRSFAKQYPASVASGALRDLIAGLRRDGEDPDTLKIVLETLLMLFEPDATSPEASEDIALWLADEFAMRQDNITALLELLEKSEFYLRLYALQILSQVCAARPQRAQEAISAAPDGPSRIIEVMKDKREAVRNEALLLLIAITPTSAELQKVVAYEEGFDHVFAIIDAEGGLTHGATTVQDCLSLLSNLLKLNSLNQLYFRENGCVEKVAKLLSQVIQEEEKPDGVSEWARPQRDLNLWGLLTVLQLFLVRGSQGTPPSQNAFWRSGVLQRVLQIAFHQTFGSNVRARALDTCASAIRGNTALQEQFGDLAVPAVRQQTSAMNGRATPKASSVKSGPSTPANVEMSNVIESLLELTLDSDATPFFDVRLAACNCVKAFFEGHNGIRGHVLRRAIDGHKSGDDAVPNILTVLLEPPNSRANADPYQQWMAAVLLLHLLNGYPESKAFAARVSESDDETEGEDGYEVVTFIQSITSNVVAGVQHPEDERALIGYLMLLSIWLFEEPDAVNDLLTEGSIVQGLLGAVKTASSTMPLVAGLCAFLLAIVYEFSTKDSPIKRAELHGIILDPKKGLNREVFLDKLTKLRESSFIRDFEVMPIVSEGGQAQVYFDQTFIHFFKDYYDRCFRAIDREPGYEASILINGVQKGVSRELVDDLRAQVDEKSASLETAQIDLASLRQQLEHEVLEHRRTRESADTKLGQIKQVNQSLQNNHEEEMRTARQKIERQKNNHQEEVQTLRQDLTRQHTTLTAAHESALAQLRKDHDVKLEQTTRQSKAEKEYLEQRRNALEKEVARHKENLAKQQAEAEKAANQAKHIQKEQQAEIEALHKNLKTFEDQLAKTRTEHESQLQATRSELQQRLDEAESQAQDTGKQLAVAKSALDSSRKDVASLQARITSAEDRASKADTSLKAAQAELEQLQAAATRQKDTQTEFDDLLVVFADLEAKRAADKKRLKDLGEDVSEDEDEGQEDGDGDEEEEDE